MGPPVQRGEGTRIPEPKIAVPEPPPAPSSESEHVGPPTPPSSSSGPGQESTDSPIGSPMPPPSPMPMGQSFQLPDSRAAIGVRLARGLPRQANLQGQPFGSPGGNDREIMDYILSRFRGG